MLATKTKSKAPRKKPSGGGGFGATKAPPKPAAPPPLATVSETFRVSEHELPSGDGINTMFMGAYLIEDETVCDNLVSLFEADPSALAPGVVGRGGRAIVDHASKESLEYSFQPDDQRLEWRRYVTALQACTMKYTEKYPYATAVSPWGLSSTTNYQYYPPGGGYKIYHTERNGRMEPGASRHLVFMTYLNDVTDEGGTQFFHQNVTIQPKKGLTLVWPSDWTFMHRGVSSPTQEKRIMTGWFNFA
jgi:hypothetical protein|eukprot:Transcript_937.p1 GENE.Transcript_937~~Transcript_937.p1  ORF type:complete len:246 (-),score=93.34 Transcript_937:183-920(-)